MNKDLIKAMKKLAVTPLSDDDSPCIVHDYMPTGCLALDAIIGGGLPVGRVTEIYGDNSTGKSLIASQVAAVSQESGASVVYIDTEAAVSKDMMAAVGVDVDNILYGAPDTVEEVFKIFQGAIDAKRLHDPDGLLVLIWDSIAATSTMAEMGKDYGEATMATHARAISQGMRKITREIANEKVLALFINQTRQKIGVMFGDDTATFGGMAVSFYASVRIQLNPGSKLKVKAKNGKKTRVIGTMPTARVVKNKVAMPFREAKLPIYFGHGIDDAKASFEYLKDNDCITNSGANYHLSLDKKELTFQKPGWEELFDKHYDAIADLMLNDSITGMIEEDNNGTEK